MNFKCIYSNDCVYNCNKHEIGEIENMLQEIFDSFWRISKNHNECLYKNIRQYSESDHMMLLVYDLFEDLWNGTNLFNKNRMMREKISNKHDYIRIVAKQVFDKLWDSKL